MQQIQQLAEVSDEDEELLDNGQSEDGRQNQAAMDNQLEETKQDVTAMDSKSQEVKQIDT